jgi:hypothetical protein
VKLTKIQVRNFRSIDDSGEFEIDDLTCLVGKNEAGKTAILRAIHGLAPTDDFKYDRTRDYPRRFLSKFDERHPKGSSEPVNLSRTAVSTGAIGLAAAAADEICNRYRLCRF